jgi:hypothetical protein
MRKNQWATELFGSWSLQHILPQRQQFSNSASFDDLVARNTMVIARNLVAMAKSRRLFRLQVFKIFTRGPNKKNYMHISLNCHCLLRICAQLLNLLLIFQK